MAMLHGCAFPGCSTLTLSAYCVEHELLVRAAKESERTHTSDEFDPQRALAIGVEATERHEPASL